MKFLESGMTLKLCNVNGDALERGVIIVEGGTEGFFVEHFQLMRINVKYRENDGSKLDLLLGRAEIG